MFGLRADDEVVIEPDAAILLAARAISTQLELARLRGADILEGTRVERIDLEGNRPTLVFDDHRIEADRLIVAAGPWTGGLVEGLPFALRPTRQQVLYFGPEELESYSIGRFPAFIFMGEAEHDAYYGMPAGLGTGVKVARHGGPGTDPASADPAIEPAYVSEVRAFLSRTVPALSSAPVVRTEVCIYTMAEQEHFRVGLLPERDDVVLASPCSGHGFKFSCLIGRVVADLAIEGSTSIAIDSWRIA